MDFFKNQNTRSMTGSSVLILVDNITKSYDIRIIDLSHFQDLDDPNQRDEGYILGLSNIQKNHLEQ